MFTFMKKMAKYFFLLVDIISIISSYLFALLLIDDKSLPQQLIIQSSSVIIYILILILARTYQRLWIYSSIKEYLELFLCCLISGLLTMAFCVMFVGSESVSLYILSMIFATILIIGFRIFTRTVFMIYKSILRPKSNLNNVLIFGAGESAKMLLTDIERNDNLKFNIVGILDDNPLLKNRYILGKKILGTRDDIKTVVKQKNVDLIVIAIPSANEYEISKIAQICTEIECDVKILPPMLDIISNGSNLIKRSRAVEIEDLLDREPITLDNEMLFQEISGKVILVTGGGGSIGSELCRQIARHNPAKLIILDIYENNAFDIQQELLRDYRNLDLVVLIASVRDLSRVEDVFEKYKPNIVFHAAAHKHVPLMEESPCEAVKNNVFGTYNVAITASKNNTEKFVLISTDKAVNPTNAMGATKRICEMIVQALAMDSKTTFAAVRFGNVLGSNGSVIPMFKKQIKKGGPVTVTDKEITRYFMTIPEAAQLVLQAACFANGGEIFVLDMGKPVKIYDLAKNIIRLSGYTLGVNMDIKIVGLRPGEKLYEELLMEEEGLTATKNEKIFIGKPIYCNKNELRRKLSYLKDVAITDDNNVMKLALAKVVPTYTIDQRDEPSKNTDSLSPVATEQQKELVCNVKN